MSDPNIHWVKIPVPHSLSDHDSLPVVGVDLLLVPVDVSWVFPGPIDIEKLKVALAKTLHDYPHGAGRLSFDEKSREWSIKLTNDAVPIITGTTDLIFDEELIMTAHPDIVESTPLVIQPAPLIDEPLIKLKLVKWKHGEETSLTLSFHHSLGDGTTVLRFMTSLSDYYLGLTPTVVPTFEKYLQRAPTLEPHLVDETLRFAPQLAEDMPMMSLVVSMQQSEATTSRVEVKFTASQLDAIRAAAELEATNKISTSDALLGYLVTVLNRISPVTIENITSIISYRGIAAAPGHEYTPPPFTSAGNVILNLTPVGKIPANAKNSIGLIASYIRNGLEQSRDLECTRRLAALFDESFSKALGSGRVHNWSIPPNACQINNMSRWPIGTNHFGYEGKTRFYWYKTVAQRYLRIWKANPVKRADGTWDSYDGGIDVAFTLQPEVKRKFLALVAQDMLMPSLVDLRGLE